MKTLEDLWDRARDRSSSSCSFSRVSKRTWSPQQTLQHFNSSAESELYAAALGASEFKGIISLMRDLGYERNPVLAIDAKATEHILHRQGIGKLKHIDVAYLWIQDEVRSRRLKVRRVRSEDNIADLGTKPLSKAVIAKHCTTMGYMNMSQADNMTGYQSWGCYKASVQCTAGDHVQRTNRSEPQQWKQQQPPRQQQQKASPELLSAVKSGSQLQSTTRIRGLDGGTRLKTIGRSPQCTIARRTQRART